MKKILLLAVIFCLIISAYAFAKTYSDVGNLPSAYEEAILFLSEKEIISGYPDGSFKPTNHITRAEVIKMIVVSFNVEYKEGINKSFSFDDVKGKWFEDYVTIGTSNGIIKGYDDGTFKPSNNVTYGEMCAMICRLLGLEEIKLEEDSNWADGYMRVASQNSLLNNIASNDLIASNNASRANVALIIYNAIKCQEELNKEVGKPEEKIEERTETPKEEKEYLLVEDLSQTKTYYAKVILETSRLGVESIDVETFDGELINLISKNIDKKPAYGSLIIFYVRSGGRVTLVKEIKADTINSGDMYIVEEAAGSLANLKDQPEKLDISLDEYVLNGNTIKLNRFDYYTIEVGLDENKKYTFEDCSEIKKDEIKLHKDDRIIFDISKKLCFIIKGIDD